MLVTSTWSLTLKICLKAVYRGAAFSSSKPPFLAYEQRSKARQVILYRPIPRQASSVKFRGGGRASSIVPALTDSVMFCPIRLAFVPVRGITDYAGRLASRLSTRDSSSGAYGFWKSSKPCRPSCASTRL